MLPTLLPVTLAGIGVGLSFAVVHDQHRDRRVVQHEVRNGAEDGRADRTPPTGAHHDQIVARTRDLCDRIPDATFSEINAGHQAYFEASEEFAAKFLAFADGLHPPGRLSSSAS